MNSGPGAFVTEASGFGVGPFGAGEWVAAAGALDGEVAWGALSSFLEHEGPASRTVMRWRTAMTVRIFFILMVK